MPLAILSMNVLMVKYKFYFIIRTKFNFNDIIPDIDKKFVDEMLGSIKAPESGKNDEEKMEVDEILGTFLIWITLFLH